MRSAAMTYQQKLRALRGDRSRAELSAASGINQSTLTKAETDGRTVKFKTVAEIVRALGHRDDSPAMREIALLWLQSVTGIHFSSDDAYTAAQELIEHQKVTLGDLLDALSNVIAERGLSPSEIQLLSWAAARPPALEILSYARQLEKYPEFNDAAQLAAVAESAPNPPAHNLEQAAASEHAHIGKVFQETQQPAGAPAPRRVPTLPARRPAAPAKGAAKAGE